MSATRSLRQDYSLLGPDGAAAVAGGLVNAEWYQTPIPRARMKELMQRSDAPALRDTAIWLSGLLAFGALGSWLFTRGSLWFLPALFCYGVLYGSASDSRWHETGHGTAFRTPWMNHAVYQLASFCMMRAPTAWRWSHARHHTDTLVVGRDPEIVAMRPPRLGRIALNLLGLVDTPIGLSRMVVHAYGRLTAEEKTYVPEVEWPKVVWEARAWVAVYAAVGGLVVATGSILPLVLVGGPCIYGTWLHLVFGLTQHAGLPENVLDHRLNCRSVRMNRLFRFLYWNMNWHVEHHMFPMVPYHRLPELHDVMKDDCAPISPSLTAAYRELLPAVLRQRTDPAHAVIRQLPTLAVQP